jgi:hypothetical protein
MVMRNSTSIQLVKACCQTHQCNCYTTLMIFTSFKAKWPHGQCMLPAGYSTGAVLLLMQLHCLIVDNLSCSCLAAAIVTRT